MERTKKKTGKRLRHFGICRVLIYACYIFFALMLLFNVAGLISMAIKPLSQWGLTDTGTHYHVDSLIGSGYWHLPYHEFPFSPPADVKKYCMVFLILSGLTTGLPLLLLLEYARRIIRVVGKEASPFLPQVAKWINRIGRVLLCMGCFSELAFQLGMGAIVYHRLWFLTSGKFPLILTGCLLLLLAEIFRRGCDLQQQADETL